MPEPRAKPSSKHVPRQTKAELHYPSSSSHTQQGGEKETNG